MTNNIVLNPAGGIPLAQQIREQMARSITKGELREGDLLPPVRLLAAQLKININTVRAAYQRLEQDGLVKTSQGVGTRVLPLNINRMMRLARAETTNTVGVILPALNTFYYTFLQGLETVANQNQTMLFVCQHHDTQDLLRPFAQLSAHKVDGIIAVSSPLNELITTASVSTATLPIVTADWPDCTGYCVQMDLKNAGEETTRHLIGHGHRRIGLITTRVEYSNVRPVNQGYEQALKQARIKSDEALIAFVDDFGLESGRQGARQLLALPEPPTAIFAIADQLALGAMQTIRESGLQIPRDVAVASFNDIDFAELAQPALTTARAPAYELGIESMKMLALLIAGRKPPKKRLTLPTSLVIRDSCGSHQGAQTRVDTVR